MFSYMRKNNPTLAAHFKHYGINDREIDFIHELILGPNGHDYSVSTFHTKLDVRNCVRDYSGIK